MSDTTTQLPFDERLKAAAKANPNHKFVNSIHHQLSQGRTLSQAQFNAINSTLDELEIDAAVLATAPHLVPGNLRFEGTITSLKDVDGKYGPRKKMIVRLTDGNKVYSSVPKGIPAPAKGLKVTFYGELTVSYTDPHFGFVKFPSTTQP